MSKFISSKMKSFSCLLHSIPKANPVKFYWCYNSLINLNLIFVLENLFTIFFTKCKIYVSSSWPWHPQLCSFEWNTNSTPSTILIKLLVWSTVYWSLLLWNKQTLSAYFLLRSSFIHLFSRTIAESRMSFLESRLSLIILQDRS